MKKTAVSLHWSIKSISCRCALLLLLLHGASRGTAQTAKANVVDPYALSYFEENVGQVPAVAGKTDVRYVLKDKHVTLYFTARGVHYAWHVESAWSLASGQVSEATGEGIHTNVADDAPGVPRTIQRHLTTMQWEHASPQTEVIGEEPTGSFANYYLANARGPVTGARHFRRIVYRDIYPNTDIVYYIKHGRLKYDVVLHENAAPNNIGVTYSGVSSLRLDSGKIKIATPAGFIEEGVPIAWDDNGIVEVHYQETGDNTFTFHFPRSGKTRRMAGKTVIDPTLLWGTYLGGGAQDYGYGVSLDATGNIFIAGHTESSGNISFGVAHQPTHGGNADAFLSKYTPAGALLWSTYFGGAQDDVARSVAVDGAGNAVFGGHTSSTAGFIPPGSHQATYGGGVSDGFLASFSSTGTLLWATYWGGPGEDVVRSVNAQGTDVYFSGYTSSTAGVATLGTYGGGTYDAVAGKVGSLGATVWSTYIGGAGDDQSWALATNGASVYVSGYSNSTAGIASAGAFQVTNAGGAYDAFLVRINASTGAYQEGTYYGGPGSETCRGVTIDGAGNVYLSGYTSSPSGISAGAAHQATYGGGPNDAFLAKFNTVASLAWGTYMGGTGDDYGRGVTTDPGGALLLTGNTNSTAGIADGGVLQSTYGGGGFDGFVARFQNEGYLLWSTYYGGAGSDYFINAASDNTGSTVLVGQTTSTVGVATGGHQTTIGGGWDALLVRMETFEVNTLYSRMDGPWEDLSTWSNVGHTGPPAVTGGGTGTDYFIGNGHTVSLTGDGGYVGSTVGLRIDAGAALDGNHFGFFPWGSLIVNGDFLDASIVGGLYELYSAHPFLVFDSLNYGILNYPGTTSNLYTDVVVLKGMRSIDGATLNYNGQDVCLAYMASPSALATTSPSPTGVTLTWNAGAGHAFVVARESATPTAAPQFGATYAPNAAFGSGSQVGPGVYVVYQGSATSVAITGLTASTDYVFEFYTYNTLVGGCYSTTTMSSLTYTTCAVVAAPTNGVAAAYCTGDPLQPVRVDNPGAGYSIAWYTDATATVLATGTPSGANNEIFTPTAAGTVFARNFHTLSGCYSTATLGVTLTALPVLVSGTASVNQNVCLGGDPAVITGGTASGGTGSYTYQWQSSAASGGPFMNIVSATSATYDPPPGLLGSTYYQRITYSGNCTQPSTVIQVAAVPLPVLVTDPLADEACDDGTAVFQISATGVALTYRWQVDVGAGFNNVTNGSVYSGATTNQLQILNATGLNNARYQCVVTSTGVCSVTSGAAQLTVSPAPQATDQVQTVCESTAGTGTAMIDLTALNDDVTNDATNTVSWFQNTAYTSPVVTPGAASAVNGTTFYARVTNASGACSNGAAAVVTVTSRPVVTTTPRNICSGTPTNIAFTSPIAGTTYTWTIPSPNGNISGASAGAGAGINQTLTNTSATQQQINYIVVPSANGCDGTPFTQLVNVDPVPTAYAVTGGGRYCALPGATGVPIGLGNSQAGVTYTLLRGGVSTGLTATPGGGAFNFPHVTVAGDYTVSGATALSCSASMTGRATVEVLSKPAGGTIASSTPAAQLCTGAEITFTVTGVANEPTDYDWTLPATVREVSRTNGAITVTGVSGGSGNITVLATNSCGDGTPVSLAVSVAAAPQVAIVLPANAYAAESLAFDHTTDAVLTNWSWTFGDGQTSADPAPFITYTGGGNYPITLDVIAQNGCRGTDTEMLVVLPEAVLGDLAIKNVVTANGDGANDLLYIERIDKYPDNEVILLDRWGAEVFRKKGYNNEWDLKNNDQYIPTGNYVCVVRYDGKVFSRTVTVLKNK